MESRFTIVVILTLVLLTSAVFAGVTSANHQTTGALNGPVYDWILDDEGNSRFSHYGLSQPTSIYFSGSYLNVDVVLARTAMMLLERDNEYDEYEDLPQDMKDQIGSPETVRKALACDQDDNTYDPTQYQTGEDEEPSDQAVECDTDAKDKAAYALVQLSGGNVERLGLLKDYTFAEPLNADVQVDANDENQNEDVNYEESPFDSEADALQTRSQWEINRWNWMSSYYGWPDDTNKGGRGEVVLPEDEHFERMAESEEGRDRQNYYNNPPEREEKKINVSYNPFNDSWVAASGMEMAIYSNDPSVWTHVHRYDNVPDDLSQFDEGKLFDRSYQQIGDNGKLRLVYEEGSLKDPPTGTRDEPLSPVAGDTRWKYEGGDLELVEFDLYIKSLTSRTCKTRCELTDAVQVNENADGVMTFNWNLEDSQYDLTGLAGERVKFIVEAEYEVSYDKQIQEAEDVCEDRADESDAEDAPSIDVGDCIEWGIDWNNDETEYDFIVESKEYETSETYTFTDGTGIFQEDDDVEVKKAVFPNGQNQYYVEFDQETTHGDVIGWNKITAGEDVTVQSQWKYFSSREKAWDDLYTHTTSNNGGKYVSKAKPLRIHAYPAYEQYNQQDSTVNIVNPETADLDMSERRPSPALVGHTTCVQNYPQEFNDTGNSPNGSYDYHEPCYWEIFAAGQDPVNPPLSYYRLPYRVTNPGWFSAIPGVADNQMSYEKYVFNKELSSMLQNTNQDDDNEDSAYQKLYRGEYTHMDEVVFETGENVDEITVHGMVPESTATEEVDETIRVSQTNMDVEVMPRCERNAERQRVNCVDNPVESDRYSEYKLKITLTRVNGEGEEVPVSTRDRDGELIVQNSSAPRVDTISPSTGDDGVTYVWIEDPDDVSERLIDVQFSPEHWRESNDPIAPSSVVSEGPQEVSGDTGWLLTLSGIMLVYWFMMVALNRAVFRDSDIEFNPVKDIVYDNADDYTKKFIILSIVIIILFKGPENWYNLFVFMISLFLLVSGWEEQSILKILLGVKYSLSGDLQYAHPNTFNDSKDSIV